MRNPVNDNNYTEKETSRKLLLGERLKHLVSADPRGVATEFTFKIGLFMLPDRCDMLRTDQSSLRSSMCIEHR